jgi:hypothetical protein
MRKEYTPARDCRESSPLGVNRPANGARFGRMADAFKRDSAYWGECGEWFIVAAQHRDSDSLSRSNFVSLLKLLGGESEQVRIERANHWAVGWVEYLIVAPANRSGLREAIYAHSSVCSYPVLDETHWSELEYNEAWDFAEGELKRYENWQAAFDDATQNGGYSDSELWTAIEAARERLEAELPLWESHASSPIDPGQGKLFADVPHL